MACPPGPRQEDDGEPVLPGPATPCPGQPSPILDWPQDDQSGVIREVGRRAYERRECLRVYVRTAGRVSECTNRGMDSLGNRPANT